MTAALALPAAAQQTNQNQTQTPEGTLAYALTGEADAFTLRLGPGGRALAYARADANSVPTASGLASAECQFDPEGAPSCEEAATEESSYPGHEGDAQTSCAKPEIPPPPGEFLNVSRGCAMSTSGLEDGLPFTRNEATAGPITVNLDFSAFPGGGKDLEQFKQELLKQLEDIVKQGPQDNPIAPLVEQILTALQEGNIGEIELGPASSDVEPDGDVIQVVSTAKGPIIRLLGVPAVAPEQPAGDRKTTAQQAEPFEGCDITDNPKDPGGPDMAWLYSIEVGESRSAALIDIADRTVDAEGDGAAVSVTSPDIESGDPTDCRTDTIAEGTEGVVIGEGTPIQSEILVGGSRTEVGDDFALARAAGVSIHLFQGTDDPSDEEPFMGGLRIAAAATNASVAMRVDYASPTPTPSRVVHNNPPEEPRVLPDTGGDDYLPIAVALLLLAVGVGVVARRLARR